MNNGYYPTLIKMSSTTNQRSSKPRRNSRAVSPVITPSISVEQPNEEFLTAGELKLIITRLVNEELVKREQATRHDSVTSATSPSITPDSPELSEIVKNLIQGEVSQVLWPAIVGLVISTCQGHYQAMHQDQATVDAVQEAVANARQNENNDTSGINTQADYIDLLETAVEDSAMVLFKSGDTSTLQSLAIISASNEATKEVLSDPLYWFALMITKTASAHGSVSVENMVGSFKTLFPNYKYSLENKTVFYDIGFPIEEFLSAL